MLVVVLVFEVALPYSASLPAQSLPQVDLSTLPNVLNANSLAALSAMPGLQAASVNQNALLAAGLTPAAAAAALQLSQLSGLAPQVIDRDSLEKAEQRRARRYVACFNPKNYCALTHGVPQSVQEVLTINM